METIGPSGGISVSHGNEKQPEEQRGIEAVMCNDHYIWRRV